ncbi:MAG TPA: hypothetical protein VKT73_12870 [Xanthobacteraceae bacterium]|nr:hypothetical protein [Xanthobacteraceae bacterium]
MNTLTAAREARNQATSAIAAVNSNFIKLALPLIEGLSASWSGTAEDIRVMLTDVGVKPNHHNAWGSLILTAVKRGLLHKVGYGQMKIKSSHARTTPLYSRAPAKEGA